MFRSLVFTALAAPHAFTAVNDELARPADRALIMVAVRKLLDHLRQGDAELAFALLSDEFRHDVVNAKRFLASMRKTCKPLCQARFVDFDCLSAVNGMLVQELSLIGLDGSQSTSYFLMEHDKKTGDWQIGSCIVDHAQAALQA